MIINNRKGSIVNLALMMMLLLTLIAISMSKISTTDVKIAGNEKLHETAFYQADGGTQIGVEILEQNINCSAQGFLKDAGETYRDINDVRVNDIKFWENSQADLATLQSTNPNSTSVPITNVDTHRSFYYPSNGSTPQTNVLAGGDTKYKAGNAIQMVAGYEGKGKGAASGGGYIDYDLYSQHLGARNSEVIININWNHIIGLEDECIYD